MESFCVCVSEWASEWVCLCRKIHGRETLWLTEFISSHLIWALWRAIKESFLILRKKVERRTLYSHNFIAFLLVSFNVQKYSTEMSYELKMPACNDLHSTFTQIDRENLKNLLHNGWRKKHMARISWATFSFYSSEHLFFIWIVFNRSRCPNVCMLYSSWLLVE